MPQTQLIIKSPGPLPIKSPFTAQGDGTVLFFVAGSGWSSSANGQIGVSIQLDGQELERCIAYTNEGASHKTLVPIFVPATLTAGDHVFTLEALPGTNTDTNDDFNVMLFY